MEKFGLKRMEVGVSLFSRQVLITNKAPILPDWLRFIKGLESKISSSINLLSGVVDSPDLPLNLSREHLQDSALVKRISNTLTRRLLKFFAEEVRMGGMTLLICSLVEGKERSCAIRTLLEGIW